MKIGWNCLGRCGGLGNNGGSRTVILSNKVLNEIGHKSLLISVHNIFNWFDYPEPLSEIPKNLDILISTQHTNVGMTLETDAKKKAWYIRSFLPNVTYKDYDILKIVNSNNVKNRMVRTGVKNEDCHVVYQGLDFDWWHDLNLRKNNNKIRIGCLYHSSNPNKNWDEFVNLSKILDHDKFEFVSFGIDKKCKYDFLNKYSSNPAINELVNLYNSCHIWFAPTKNEGLHNVPMEAALCGCLIMCGNYEGNGMLYDYAFPNETAMVYNNLKEAVEMIENPNYSLIPKMQDCLRTNIGTREENMKKMLNIIE